jgi:WG containing repeat
MYKKIALLIVVFITINGFSQEKELLYRYEIAKKDDTYYGFKDKKGKVIFPAKYNNLGVDSTFKNIIPVGEYDGKKLSTYYLLRNGKKVLQDSVYMDEDFYGDTEQEDMIRFETQQPNRIGFLNKDGQIVLPNIYNWASAFNNGFAVVLQNAKRKCWEGTDTIHCEHPGWEGGVSRLINKKGDIIIDSFPYSNIDFFSLKINQTVDANYYTSYKAVNGDTYSFIDKEKHFTYWFNTIFKKEYQNNLANYLFQNILLENQKEKGKRFTRKYFTKEVFTKSPQLNLWIKKLSNTFNNTDSTIQYDILSEDFLVDMTERKAFRPMLDANGKWKLNQHPIFLVTLSYYKPRATEIKNLPLPPPDPATGTVKEPYYSPFQRNYEFDVQEGLTFIKVGDTYKLVELLLRK